MICCHAIPVSSDNTLWYTEAVCKIEQWTEYINYDGMALIPQLLEFTFVLVITFQVGAGW